MIFKFSWTSTLGSFVSKLGAVGSRFGGLVLSWLRLGRRSWGHFGSSSAILTLNWRVLGSSWAHSSLCECLGCNWGVGRHIGSQIWGLGLILGPSWRVLGLPWVQLDMSRGHTGSKLRLLGGCWLQVGGCWGHSGSNFEALHALWLICQKNLTNSCSYLVLKVFFMGPGASESKPSWLCWGLFVPSLLQLGGLWSRLGVLRLSWQQV